VSDIIHLEWTAFSTGCLTPNEPVDESYGDAAFERDLPIT
jgi:hypothetical protein